MLRKFRISRLPQKLKTSDGKYFINIGQIQRFNSHTASGSYNCLATIESDLKSIREKFSLDKHLKFTIDNYGILIKYNRIEEVKNKCFLTRSHFLDVCNGLSSKGLEIWIHNYDYYFNDHKSISFIVENLDSIYENSIQCKDEDFFVKLLNTKLTSNHLINSHFVELFNFNTNNKKNKFRHKEEYLRKKELLKIYISVFAELSCFLHPSEIKTSGDYAYVNNIKEITNYLISYQIKEFNKITNGEVVVND